jgi:hypothetical protein
MFRFGVGQNVGLAGITNWQPVLSARFDTPGLVTLPSWLTYTCASTVTAQTSASTLIKGVGVNQAVANLWGLQVECTSTNYCLSSDNYNNAAWANDAGSRTFNQTDPYGGSAGCQIQGASYGLHQVLAQTSTSFSTSCYYTWSGATNSSACVTLRTAAGSLTSFVENPVQNVGYQRTTQSFNGTSSLSANLWFQNSDYGGAINSNCTFAFPQVELLPFSTSYIPTAASAVTRAAGILKATLPDCTDMVFDYEFVASHGPGVGATGDTVAVHFIGSSATAWFGTENSSQKFRMTTPGGSPLGTVVLSWGSGDVVRFVVTLNYASNSVAYTCFVNGAKIADETVALALGMATLASNTIYVFGTSAGTQHTSPAGIRRITITPLPWSTINATSFNQPGLTTLPAWLAFTCASTRTAEVTPSTLLTGIGANQAVTNRWGLQHETTTANLIPNTQNMSAWSPGGSATRVLGFADPAGGTGAAALTGGGGAGFYQVIVGGPSTTYTVSSWTSLNGVGTQRTLIGVADAGVAPIAGVTEQPTGNTWHRLSASYSGASVQGVYATLSDRRAPVNAQEGDALYAFAQVSTLPFETSYIPTSGTSQTRAASILKATLPAVSDMKISMSFVASHAPQNMAGAYDFLLCNGTNGTFWIAIASSRQLSIATVTQTSGLVSWAAGDSVSIDITLRSVAKTVTYVVRVNGVQTFSDTVTHTVSPAFDATQITVGSASDGTLHLSPRGLVSLAVATR